MRLITSDKVLPSELGRMLEGYDCPAILVSPSYEILATNQQYQQQFGALANTFQKRCYEVSHGYNVPCDQAGEDCPLTAAQLSGHKERVLHIHQTPRGKEHVDVEMLPIFDDHGELLCFVELLRSLPTKGDSSSQQLVGTSKAFNDTLARVARVSQSDAAVLLLGESGTGKELIARAIHQGSEQKKQALVTLECSGLTDTLFESELFGHVRGAFTGASVTRKGLVELADGGTLFLDEIGDVPLSMQVKLLRLIETGTFRPVGSSEVKHSRFRLICATHKNIAEMVKSGEFRQDLYYRINVFPILIPALRERSEDLALLVSTLLKRISPQKDFHLTNTALQLLKQYRFPGNIRELRNILNRAVILADTNLLEARNIHEAMGIDQQNLTSEPTREEGWVDLKTAEQVYLRRLLQAHNGDKAAVAKIANISLRSLYRKLDSVKLILEMK